MPVLRNARHEAFAQALAKGKTADEAYQLAGFKPNRGNASTLKAKQNIAERIIELKQMVAERVVVDREWVLARLIENAQHTQKSNPSASNQALQLIGKEIGMFVERTENLNHNYQISDEPPTEEEWAAEHAAKH